MFKNTLIVLLMLFSARAFADANSLNLTLPQTQQNFQSDRIRAGDLECSAAIGSSTNVEFGVVGLLNQSDPTYNLAAGDPYMPYNYDNFMRDIGVYGRIVIPLGAPKERLNCNTLYQLELKKKRLEVLKLEREVQQLRALRFEETND
jgi:hypothetical protein